MHKTKITMVAQNQHLCMMKRKNGVTLSSCKMGSDVMCLQLVNSTGWDRDAMHLHLNVHIRRWQSREEYGNIKEIETVEYPSLPTNALSVYLIHRIVGFQHRLNQERCE